MKNLLIVLSLSVLAVSCGKDNKVNSQVVSGSNGLAPSSLVNFEGNYDLRRMDSDDCGGAIQIVAECNGYKLLSNNMGPEEFCNINRVPPNPDLRNPGRIPPHPNDRDPRDPRDSRDGRDNRDNNDAPVVTQVANVLKSEVTVNERISFTNTLTLNDNGILVKVANLKSRTTRCVYQKR